MVFIDCSKFACAISSKQAQIESYIGENEDITTTAFISWSDGFILSQTQDSNSRTPISMHNCFNFGS